MATVAERVQLDDITVQARQVRFGRALLTVFAAVFFTVGWVVGRAFLAVAWCAVAVKVGWQAGRAPGGLARTHQ